MTVPATFPEVFSPPPLLILQHNVRPFTGRGRADDHSSQGKRRGRGLVQRWIILLARPPQ
jgi:hypothetical protein